MKRLILCFFCFASLLGQNIPDRPSDIQYPALKTQIPNRTQNMHDLQQAKAFLVEDHALPLIQINLYAKGGGYLEPQGKEGLSELTATMLQNGGTESLAPQAFQERLDFLSTEIEVSISDTRLTASLNCLTSNLDESLQLFFDMLQRPRLDAERLAIEKQNMLEQLRRRNDDTRAMEPRYWSRLLYGPSFYSNHLATQTSIDSIDAASIRQFKDQILVQGNLVLAVSGDITPATLKKVMKSHLAKFAKGSKPADPPKDWQMADPGLYGVQKDGVNQTRVTAGYLGLTHGNPDRPAVDVMNEILGGGGFTSRITSRIRSDEGLAYSAGSQFSTGFDTPGTFRIVYQSKNESVAFALKIALEEIQKIRDVPVSEEELKIAKEGVVSGLLPFFDDPASTAQQFARAYMINEDPEYLAKYQESVRKITVADVQQAAQKYLNRDKLIILLTGDLAGCLPGDGNHGSLEEVTGLKLERLPLFDPLTLQPLEPTN
ncbi:MAG: insulinase family protein [Acidobacteria bacterium]|nr:insulinase family protein [Acidobacteriota bacterium]MCB9399483.1 insulinase family protein [Acidobacteriota bacterium]